MVFIIEIRTIAGIVSKRFIMKQVCGLYKVKIIPAAAGPISLAELKQAEFSDIALLRSFLSSMRLANIDCLNGVYIAIIQFSISPSMIIVIIFKKSNAEASVIRSACTINNI